MATLNKVVPGVREENKSLFPSHTGVVHVMKKASQDNSFFVYEIWTEDAPTLSNFNDAPVGSVLVDLSDGSVHHKTS